MPEWPEVGVVKESLKRKLLNQKIRYVQVYWDRIIATSLDLFPHQIVGQTIHDIDQYGKYLIFLLDDYDLIVHLRMEGKFFYRDVTEPRGKHEHVIFGFDDFELRYCDTRKFGKMYLIPKEEVWNQKPLLYLGSDPYSKDLTGEYLYGKLKGKRIPIKTSLLDQSIIVGIGNIYADEILSLSHIHPLKPSNKVTKKELELIIQNMRLVFDQAMQMGGTTIRTYSSEEGVHGRFQQSLIVHTKKYCAICNTPIIKIKVGGRGTYYCPHCQTRE